MARSTPPNTGPDPGPERENSLQAPLRARASSRSAGACQPVLTDREEEVLACLGEGLLYKEIEERLRLSHTALRKRQHRVYAKLGAQNRTEALNRWRETRTTATEPGPTGPGVGGGGVKEAQSGVFTSMIRAKDGGPFGPLGCGMES